MDKGLYNEIALALTPYHFSFSSRSIRHFVLCIFRIRSFIPSKLFSRSAIQHFLRLNSLYYIVAYMELDIS